MTESQRAATSSVNSKEKTSLLDLDIGKDFLSSWKSMSVADDGMDFDFGSATKGNKKAFNFDKADLDFTLDGDFDKLSSFKIDMSDLDVSSPPKKDGKTKERSKEVSPGGKHRAKTDSFTFQFDFNEFDSLSFESRLTKGDEKSNKDQDREGLSNISGSGGSGAHPAEDIDAMEDDIASKFPALGSVDSSKIDTLFVNVEDHDTRNEDGCSKSVTDDSYPPKSTNLGEQFAIQKGRTSPEKKFRQTYQKQNKKFTELLQNLMLRKLSKIYLVNPWQIMRQLKKLLQTFKRKLALYIEK